MEAKKILRELKIVRRKLERSQENLQKITDKLKEMIQDAPPTKKK